MNDPPSLTAPHTSELDVWEPDSLLHYDDEFDVEAEQETMFSNDQHRL